MCPRPPIFMAALLGLTVGAVVSHASAQTRPPARALSAKLVSCRVPGVETEVLCGRHDVFEDRGAGHGRTIALNVVVLPATTDSVADDPLFFLAGGGVVPATRYARFLGSAMPTLRRHRDIVLVDQRGTGGSNALSCDRAALDTVVGLPPDARFLRYVAACQASLRDRADVRFYTTSFAMDDLDDIRAWLGYPTINLYGASYGTLAALTYARRHPTHVRTMVMHGVVPPDVPMQVDLARSAQRSLERVLDLCAADVACHTAYPDVRADLAAVLSRFDSAAAAQSGQGGNVGQPFRDAVNDALSSVEGIRSVPMLVHAASTGAPPAGNKAPPRGGPEPAPLGVRLAILCSEGLSDIDTATIAPATGGTFLGDFPVRFQLRWCDGWPTSRLAAGFRAPLRSATPALLLTGELDPITPPAYAEHVGAWFTNGTVLTLPRRSHSDADRCVTAMIEAFVASGGHAPSTACLAATPPIPFVMGRQ